jgi:hypothetical protein
MRRQAARSSARPRRSRFHAVLNGIPSAADIVERVGSAKEAELEHWIDRVLTAPSLDLVFAET